MSKFYDSTPIASEKLIEVYGGGDAAELKSLWGPLVNIRSAEAVFVEEAVSKPYMSAVIDSFTGKCDDATAIYNIPLAKIAELALVRALARPLKVTKTGKETRQDAVKKSLQVVSNLQARDGIPPRLGMLVTAAAESTDAAAASAS